MTMKEHLLAQYAAFEAERRVVLGPNPVVVATLSFPISQLGEYARLDSDALLALATKGEK